jgi:hypothetical protein
MIWLRAWWMTLPRSSFLPDASLALLGTAWWQVAMSGTRVTCPIAPAPSGTCFWTVPGAIALQLAIYIYMRLMRPKRLISPE